jgi:hypothetical protein
METQPETIEGQVQINTDNIDDDDTMTSEEAERASAEEKRIREEAEKEEKRKQEEEKRKKEEEKAKKKQEYKRKQEEEKRKKEEEKAKKKQEEEEQKRKQAEEEQKRKEDEAKKTRRYNEYLDVKKTIFLQMPTLSLFTLLSKKKYKLLYIPYTYFVETELNQRHYNRSINEITESDDEDEYNPYEANEDANDNYESNLSSSWFGSNRNDKLIEININRNQITNYTKGATYDKEMREYKNFDVEMLYVRLIFSINKSKEISLYNIFLYYIINVRGKTSTRPDVYKLDNFTLYDDELEILNKKNSKLDISDLLTNETNENKNNNVYYVYIYDITKNKMVAEYNIANLDNIHNVENENMIYGGIKESKSKNTRLQNKTHIQKTIRSRHVKPRKTLRNLRK